MRSWDEQVMQFVDHHRSAGLTHAANQVMEVGTSMTAMAIGVVIAVAVVVWRRWYRPAAAAVASYLVATVAADVLKDAFGRSRPPLHASTVWVSGPSFPSTHAATTSALAVSVLLSVVWVTRRRALLASAALLTLVALVGVCMVYLGAHWVSDVLAGWLLGTVIGAAIGWCARPRSRQPAPARAGWTGAEASRLRPGA